METFVCKYSDKGGRPNNEDAIAAETVYMFLQMALEVIAAVKLHRR